MSNSHVVLFKLLRNAIGWDDNNSLPNGIYWEEIIDIAQNDSDWHIRQFAVAYIEDEEALKDILINDSINSVSIKAMEQISDIDFLIKCVRKIAK